MRELFIGLPVARVLGPVSRVDLGALPPVRQKQNAPDVATNEVCSFNSLLPSLGRRFLMFWEPHFNLLARLYKRIVVPIPSPWSRRNIEHRDELPISNVDRLQPEIIANGRRNIEPGGVVCIRLWPFIPEDVLEMIRPEWTAILPLRITSAVSFANGDPMILANRLTIPAIGLLKPWNN